MPNSDECVITFPVRGIFGVARLATKLNELLKRGRLALGTLVTGSTSSIPRSG